MSIKFSNKFLYTLEIKSTKILPIIISLLYIINVWLSYVGYDLEILPIIGGYSLIPLLKLYLDSWTFKLCTHHRIFIYYIFLHNSISTLDYYTNYTLFEDRQVVIFYTILFGLFLFLYIILKRRYDFSVKNGSKVFKRYC